MTDHGDDDVAAEVSDDAAIVSVDERLASFGRRIAALIRRSLVPFLVVLGLLLLGGIYAQVQHARLITWLEDVRNRGLIVSHSTWIDRQQSGLPTSYVLSNLLTGAQVTVHVEDSGQLHCLVAAPQFPGGASLHLMLPYEPSAEELQAMKERFPRSTLFVFSRKTRTGRQVW